MSPVPEPAPKVWSGRFHEELELCDVRGSRSPLTTSEAEAAWAA